MFLEIKDYREILQKELQKKINKNSKYSLRAFARDIGIAPARLSQVLLGKQGISKSVALNIAKKLNFNSTQTEYFCDLVDFTHARSKASKDLAEIRLSKYKNYKIKKMQFDTIKMISDWYHYAILQMTHLEHFKYNIEWISKKLNINEKETKEAIERLIRLKLIEEKDGTLIDTENEISTGDIPSDAIKNYHKQILEKAQESIFNQDPKDRDLSAIIMSFDQKDIGKVKESIKYLRRKLAKEIISSEKTNSVYCLSIQFFNMLESESG